MDKETTTTTTPTKTPYRVQIFVTYEAETFIDAESPEEAQGFVDDFPGEILLDHNEPSERETYDAASRDTLTLTAYIWDIPTVENHSVEPQDSNTWIRIPFTNEEA